MGKVFCKYWLILLLCAVPVVFCQTAFPRLTAGQQMHYMMYLRFTQQKVDPFDFDRKFYAQVKENCAVLVVGYSNLRDRYEEAALQADAQDNSSAVAAYRRSAKLYDDWSAACQTIVDECGKLASSQSIRRALEKFLEIERFVLIHRLENLGREWLTKEECEGLKKAGYRPEVRGAGY